MSTREQFTLEQAVDTLLAHAGQAAPAERLSLLDALGRVAAQDLAARLDQPPFDRSPLDGYALRHADIEGASAEAPAQLTVTQHIFAGDVPAHPLSPGQAARIMTGAPLPSGASCVVRQEDTDGGLETVAVYVSLREHDNYIWRGEDVAKGELLIQKGQRFDAAILAVLAGQGFVQAEAFPRPCIGVLSTGSELSAAGGPLAPGHIYDSNRFYLAARVAQLGGVYKLGDTAEDAPAHIARAVEEQLRQCDMVITTGGVSVGAHDYMPAVARHLGMAQLFHGIGIKPGGAALACARAGKLLLCLSGNPFAAAATFELLAAPVICKLCGRADAASERVSARLVGSFPKESRCRRMLRARICGDEVSLPQGGHASGKMATMRGCNCLMDVPAGTPPLKTGTQVSVVLLKNV